MILFDVLLLLMMCVTTALGCSAPQQEKQDGDSRAGKVSLAAITVYFLCSILVLTAADEWQSGSELGHLDGHHSALIALIAQASAAAVFGLL